MSDIKDMEESDDDVENYTMGSLFGAHQSWHPSISEKPDDFGKPMSEDDVPHDQPPAGRDGTGEEEEEDKEEGKTHS